MNLAMEHAIKFFNGNRALLQRERHLNVQFEEGEEYRFIKTARGGYFTTDPYLMWAWDEHLSGRDGFDD